MVEHRGDVLRRAVEQVVTHDDEGDAAGPMFFCAPIVDPTQADTSIGRDKSAMKRQSPAALAGRSAARGSRCRRRFRCCRRGRYNLVAERLTEPPGCRTVFSQVDFHSFLRRYPRVAVVSLEANTLTAPNFAASPTALFDQPPDTG